MFSVCPHLGRGYPGQVRRWGEGVVPRPGLTGGWIPHPGLTGGTPARSDLGGYPSPQQGYPPSRGTPGSGTPPPPGAGQHMEYLISGGRYASCVHAGGLSCVRSVDVSVIVTVRIRRLRGGYVFIDPTWLRTVDSDDFITGIILYMDSF